MVRKMQKRIRKIIRKVSDNFQAPLLPLENISRALLYKIIAS